MMRPRTLIEPDRTMCNGHGARIQLTDAQQTETVIYVEEKNNHYR